jgi:hypothetical protein
MPTPLLRLRTPTGGVAATPAVCTARPIDSEQQLRTINLHPKSLGGRAMLWGVNTATPMELQCLHTEGGMGAVRQHGHTSDMNH